MHRYPVGEMLGQVRAQHINDKGRRRFRCEHRNLRPFAHRQQRVWRHLSISQHEHRRLQRHDAGNPPCAIFRSAIGQVGNLADTENLQSIGVDVIEVTDQIGTGAGRTDGDFVKTALGSPEPRHPLPFQCAAKLLKQDIRTDNGGFHRCPGMTSGDLRRLPL